MALDCIGLDFESLASNFNQQLHPLDLPPQGCQLSSSHINIASVMPSIWTVLPLQEAKDIRVLSLYPANNHGDALRGELEVGNLEGPLNFEALSYTWAPPFEDLVLDDDTIEIFGSVCEITGNLGHALRRLRLTTGLLRLWVDAICIDQANPEERGQQVGIMADIFGSANRVLAWLGEDSEFRDGEFVLEYRCNIQRFWCESDVDKTAFCLHFFLEPLNLDYARSNLDHLFGCRRYFIRRWVLQEQVVARDILLICGKWRLGYQDFIREIAGSGLRARLYQTYKSGVETLRCSKSIHIVGTLGLWANAKCSDDRDMILALASLWKDIDLTVDYLMSTEEVYAAFAEALVKSIPQSEPESTDVTETERELRHLLSVAAGQCPDRRNPSSLPSWIPDWRLDPEVLHYLGPGKVVKLGAHVGYGKKLHITLVHYGELRSRETKSRIGDREYYLLSGSDRIETTQLGINKHLDDLRRPNNLVDGSIVCSVVKATEPLDLWRSLLLHPVNNKRQEYLIIGDLRLIQGFPLAAIQHGYERRITIV